MTKKWIAINVLLLAVTGLLGWQLHNSVLHFYAANDLSKLQPARDARGMAQEQTTLKPMPKKVYNTAEFSVVADKNLFSDLRSKEEKTDVVAAPPEPPPLAQKPILVGISISGDRQQASIIDPTLPGQSRRAQIKRIGDSYSGYIITEITADRIVLSSGTRREIIPLHEGTKRSQPGKTPIQATRVVSFGGGTTGGASGGTAPAASAATSTSTTPARTQAVNVPTPMGGAGSQPRTQTGATQQPTPQAQPSQQPAPSAPRVMKTPFGDVMVP